MRILAFDTSTKFLSIACLENTDVVARFHEDVGIRHSEIIVPTIEKMLGKINWTIAEVELVCVGLGPGSFTGLRIAVATVKGFAAAVENKVVGVPTMDAMVMNLSFAEKRVAPFIDARKGKVYTCIYDRTGREAKKLTDYLLVTVDEFLKSLDEEVLFFGDAVTKYKDELENSSLARYDEKVDWYPRAENIGRIGYKKALTATDDPKDIEPLYLHAKEANITEENIKRVK
ncbi:MAG: tRNA (adenosine(37)-N6)-threonylcarbamoyltransferase complex dimerization subunit type 1 TsaB [Candidatus Omnitrophota bacterium]